jgi:hypothetical protein
VLDDVRGEAEETHSHNPWLTYGMQLHRAREWGVHDKVRHREPQHLSPPLHCPQSHACYPLQFQARHTHPLSGR